MGDYFVIFQHENTEGINEYALAYAEWSEPPEIEAVFSFNSGYGCDMLWEIRSVEKYAPVKLKPLSFQSIYVCGIAPSDRHSSDYSDMKVASVDIPRKYLRIPNCEGNFIKDREDFSSVHFFRNGNILSNEDYLILEFSQEESEKGKATNLFSLTQSVVDSVADKTKIAVVLDSISANLAEKNLTHAELTDKPDHLVLATLLLCCRLLMEEKIVSDVLDDAQCQSIKGIVKTVDKKKYLLKLSVELTKTSQFRASRKRKKDSETTEKDFDPYCLLLEPYVQMKDVDENFALLVDVLADAELRNEQATTV